MNTESRESVVAESYPTFWDDAPPPARPTPVPAELAYSAFVSLVEGELPDEFPSDDGDAEADSE